MKPGKFLLLAVLLFAGIIIYLNKCSSTDKTQGSSTGNKSTPALSVNGVIVVQHPLEEIIFSSGSILANEEVEVRNEIAGKITSILFKEGSNVKKGAVLVKLYDVDLRAQLKKLDVQIENASRNESRQKDLLSINGVSRQEYEEAFNQLRSLEADQDLIKSNLSKTEIRAPFDGVIGLKAVSNGAYLPPNTRIATIQQMDPLKIEFSIPERFRSRVKLNQQVRFTSESSEGKFTATIYAFEPKIDLETRSVLVRAVCLNKNLKLVPGGFVQIEIPLEIIPNAILIPTQALIPEMRGQKVFITADGKAKKIAVEAGMRTDSTVQITGGLTPGDTVLITGIMQIRPDMPVKVNIVQTNDQPITKTIN